MPNRRDFLRGAAAAGGWLAFRGLLPDPAHAAKTFPGGTWGGNFPSSCHDVVRDRAPIPVVAPSRKVDVCIVGGGLAGLTTAYKLRDTSFVLLEHLDRLGGHAVRDRWSDVWYSGAGAYFVTPEEPLDAFYEELGFPLVKIAEPADSAILHWNPVTDTFGTGIEKLPYPAAVRKDFARARKDFLELADSEDYPLMPISTTSEASKKFDTMTFGDWLTKEKKYHPAVKAYIDLYARSAFSAPSTDHISAFAGLNFYLSEFTDRYAFPGGNALAAEMIRDKVDEAGANRILANATAVSVEPKGSRIHVTYLDKNGRAAAVDAKVVVMACPKYIAKRIIKDLPKDQAAAMDELEYGSYVVANVLCSQPITDKSYDTWTDVAPFTDYIVADWVTRGADLKSKSVKQVLTCYYPIDYKHVLLLDDQAYDTFRNSVVDGLEMLHPGAEAKIEDVRLYRWGHALCHAKPGWYVNKGHVASRALGNVLFAHSDNQGLPAFESALVEGLTVADQVREKLAG